MLYTNQGFPLYKSIVLISLNYCVVHSLNFMRFSKPDSSRNEMIFMFYLDCVLKIQICF